jgi:hypothetical protein
MTKSVFIVQWCRALADEAPDAFGGVDGTYLDLEEALDRLEQSRDEIVSSSWEEIEDEEDIEYIKNSIQVYGSRDDHYFEITYLTPNDTQVDFYLSVVSTILRLPEV